MTIDPLLTVCNVFYLDVVNSPAQGVAHVHNLPVEKKPWGYTVRCLDRLRSESSTLAGQPSSNQVQLSTGQWSVPELFYNRHIASIIMLPH